MHKTDWTSLIFLLYIVYACIFDAAIATASISAKTPPNMIYMYGGVPNSMTFPFKRITVDLTNDCEPVVLEGTELQKSLQYMATEGYIPLVEQLKELQTRVHHLSPEFWNNRNLLVTTGVMDGLSKALEMSLNEEDPILFHIPCFPGVLEVIRPYKPRLIRAEEDEECVNPRLLRLALEAEGPADVLRKKNLGVPKMLYLCPTASNPSGKTISTERKREIYKIACEFDLIILEDDPYYFIHFGETDPVSFMSMDTECRVLRFDSLSKVLGAGLRLGFVTGPKPLLERIEMHMQASTIHTSGLTQGLVNNLLRQWGPEGLDQHVQSIRKFYCNRRDIALAAAETHLKGLAEWTIPGGGLFLWVKLIGRLTDAKRVINIEQCLAHGVMVLPGISFKYYLEETCPYIRISYSMNTPDDIHEGFARLARMLKANTP